MKQIVIHFIVCCILCCSISQSFAQAGDSLQPVMLKGVTWDSVHATVLRSSTIAVYIAKDTTLLAYTLSDIYGEFNFKKLPTEIPLKIVASFVGHKAVERQCIIPSSTNFLNMGNMDLPMVESMLEDVIVKSILPPVRMNGDTLEFNADAFRMDPNAQTEDLLRILPGITIWNDGTITINGREVIRVLVNGKLFFGTDARIATQNIPKNIIDKVQVYQKDKQSGIVRDSVTEINIKLKKGKDVGYFGRISGGYATGHRYEMEGNLNIFNKKSQLGLVFTNNNVNKFAQNVNFLLVNQTFKKQDARTDYKADFTQQGRNQFTAAGLLLRQSFTENVGPQGENNLNTEYFLTRNNQNLLKSTQTITALTGDRYFTQQFKSESNNNQLTQKASSEYHKQKYNDVFYLSATYQSKSSDGITNSSTLLSNESSKLLSENTIDHHTVSNTHSTYISASVLHTDYENTSKNIFSQYHIKYSTLLDDSKINQDLKSLYQSFKYPLQLQDIKRKYSTQTVTATHNISFEFPKSISKIFDHSRLSNFFDMGIKNDLRIETDRQQNDVGDLNIITGNYGLNNYLTNKTKQTILDVRPAYMVTKNIVKSLSGRYETKFSSSLSIGPQFYHLGNTSGKIFQQFSKSYQNWVGRLNVNYNNTKISLFSNTVSFEALRLVEYPTAEQLVPLTDSSNLNFIVVSNPGLKEQYNTDLSLNLKHISLRTKNTYSYTFALQGGYKQNYFASNNTIDSLGRNIYFVGNANYYQYGKLTIEIRKSLKLKYSQFQLSLSPNVFLAHEPIFINSVLRKFYNFSFSFNPELSYSYKDRYHILAMHRQFYSTYTQTGDANIHLVTRITQSELGCSVNFNQRLSLSSNAIYTRNFLNKNLTALFTIWNASVAYRFLKANNIEVKLSALDILHQNTGLINFGSNNSVTQGKVNALQQYFMLTLSYFPRKFGK